jgi:hypothetical protein
MVRLDLETDLLDVRVPVVAERYLPDDALRTWRR